MCYVLKLLVGSYQEALLLLIRLFMERMEMWKVAVIQGYLCVTFSLVPVSHSNDRKRGTDLLF